MLVLPACQFISKIDKAADLEEVSESDGLPKGTNPPSKRLPNPYLANPIEVPIEAQARFQSATEAFSTNQWQQAEQDLLWITEHYSELSGPWLNLALLYDKMSHDKTLDDKTLDDKTNGPDKVEYAFSRAIETNNQNVYAYNQYGVFLRKQGDFAKAEKNYKQALVVWPDFPEGHLNLAILYDLYLGKLTLALHHYESYQALQDEPKRQVSGWIIDVRRRLKTQ